MQCRDNATSKLRETVFNISINWLNVCGNISFFFVINIIHCILKGICVIKIVLGMLVNWTYCDLHL